MKKIVFFLAMCLGIVSLPVSAQDFEGADMTIETSEPIMSKRNDLSYFISGDDDVVFSRNTIKRKPYLIRYNENLEESDRLLLTPDIVPKRSYIESINTFNGGLLVFYSTLDSREKTNTLYYVTLSQEDLSTLQTAEKVTELNYTSKRNSGSYNVAISRDSSKMLVFANTPFKRARDAKDEVSVVVIDKDYSVLWDGNLTLPYAERDFNVSSYNVDNEGNVYVFGTHRIEKSKRKRGESKITYKMLTYTEEGAEMEEHDINLSGKFISEIGYLIKNNGNILCSGTYSDESEAGSKGAFYLELEHETMEVMTENLVEFDLDFLKEGLSERAERKIDKRAKKGKSVEFYRYVVRNLVENGDGGLIMVAEQYYVTRRTYTDANGNTTTTYYYHYNDVIVVSFNEDGEIEWNKKVQKMQYSVNDGGYYSGFNLVAHEDLIHLFFVDGGSDVPDLGYTKSSDRDNWKATHLVHVTVSVDGDMTTESLGTIERREFTPVPKKFKSLRNGKTIIYLKTKREHKIGRITLD